MPQFVAWAGRLCKPGVVPQGDLLRDALYLDLLWAISAQEQWMSLLVNQGYYEVEAQLLRLFPDRASPACGEKFELHHLQKAVVALMMCHGRLVLFGEAIEAAEVA